MAALEVLWDDQLSPPAAAIRVGEHLLPHIGEHESRARADVKRLCTASASLDVFSELSRRVGGTWWKVHEAVCAGLQPVVRRRGELLFQGVHSLKASYLILHGEAALLATESLHRRVRQVTVLQPGALLSKTVITWLEPQSFAAVAQTDMQLLELPHCETVKLTWLQVLHSRVETLRTLPLLSNCSDAGLRMLAFAARAKAHAARSTILQQGGPCSGLTLLTEGSASIYVSLEAGDATTATLDSHSRPSDGSTRAFLGVVHAPELLGVVDLMLSIVKTGGSDPTNKATRRRLSLGHAVSSIDAFNSVSVVANCACAALHFCTEALLLHAGQLALVDMANAADARGMVRDALLQEIARQQKTELIKGRMRENWAHVLASGVLSPRPSLGQCIAPSVDRRGFPGASPESAASRIRSKMNRCETADVLSQSETFAELPRCARAAPVAVPQERNSPQPESNDRVQESDPLGVIPRGQNEYGLAA
ncbi:hypothetical protein AB1Y20_010456 [Prymnesium parvum]|uniref:Cyclic nucleotide-binding domain-containing protein n=1 Tax=Prymnesium parvum TaxID=97485 RepID=A0AB34IPT8_PRYPA